MMLIYYVFILCVLLNVTDPDVQRSSSRALTYQTDVDQRTPQDPTGSDDEDYNGESSGTA